MEMGMVWTKKEMSEGLGYLMKLGFPNGVQYEFITYSNDFVEDMILRVRCKTCGNIGLKKEFCVTEEYMLHNFDAIQYLKGQLVDHAIEHNLLVSNLVEKYGLSNPLNQKPIEPPYPKTAPPPKTLEKLGGIGFMFSDKEFHKFFESGPDPLEFFHMEKDGENPTGEVKEIESGRRISLDEEEQ
jgi:hypothetical protein